MDALEFLRERKRMCNSYKGCEDCPLPPRVLDAGGGVMVSDEALKKLQEQIAAWPMTQRFVVQQLIRDYLRDREDLRAYEDTGLTPERCAEFARADAEGRYIVMRDAEQEGVARLRELAEADKDGRLVVLEKGGNHG